MKKVGGLEEEQEKEKEIGNSVSFGSTHRDTDKHYFSWH
jgi:hypothetical protein